MSRGNYDEAPRYARKTLQQLIGADGTGKSPNTRLLFTAAQLISDQKLQLEIDAFMQPLFERLVELEIRSAALSGSPVAICLAHQELIAHTQ